MFLPSLVQLLWHCGRVVIKDLPVTVDLFIHVRITGMHALMLPVLEQVECIDTCVERGIIPEKANLTVVDRALRFHLQEFYKIVFNVVGCCANPIGNGRFKHGVRGI